MSAELQVPADAVEDLNHHRYLMYPDTPADDVRAIAAPVVAAELRRLAAEDTAEIDRIRFTASCYSNGMPASLQPAYDRHLASRSRLLARADELDGGVS